MEYVNLAIDGIVLGCAYAFVALGFHLIYRTSGVLDFAQGDKAVIGGLIALDLVNSHVPLLLTLLLVIVIGFGLGIVYEVVVIRYTRRLGIVPAIIATVGASLLLENGQQMIWGSNSSPLPSLTSGGFHIGSINILWQNIWTVGILALAVLGLMWFLNRTRFGKGMVASASDPVAASTLGINPSLVRSVAFGLAFSLAVVGGVLVAPFTLVGGAIGATFTLKGFTGAILGGLESAVGVVVGAIMLGLIESIGGKFIPNSYLNPLDYTILLVVLLIKPSGLMGPRRQRLA
jgi:branched-chain amino acid transport system permease protein